MRFAPECKSFRVRLRKNHTQACGGAAGVSPTPIFLKTRNRDGDPGTTAHDGEHCLPIRMPAKH